MATYYVDPAAVGANDGSSWTDAWTQLQSAATAAVAEDVVYCRGYETLSSSVDVASSGTSSSGTPAKFIKFIGCNAAGDVDGTRYVLDGNSSVSECWNGNGQSFIWLENFEIKNSTNDNVAAGSSPNNQVYINIYSHDSAYEGFELYRITGGPVWLIRCRIESNGRQGVHGPYVAQLYMLFCVVKDNGDDGLVTYYAEGTTCIGCIFHNNGGIGVVVSNVSESACLFNCVIDGNDGGHGYVHYSTDVSAAIGCRITNHTYAIINNTGKILAGWNGYTGWNTIATLSYNSNTDTNEEITSADYGYNDLANDDFNLTSSADLKNVAIELD